MAATCAMVIVSPGRLVCGIVFALELCLLMVLGILFRALMKKIKLDKLLDVLTLCFVVYFTLLFKQFLILLMPEIALQMSFVLFLPSISTFTTVFLMDESGISLSENLRANLPSTLLFAGYMLLISLVRDVFGYGTLTLPAYGRHFELVLFNSDKVSVMPFLATIPGALMLTSLTLAAYLWFERKFHIMYKAGVN